MRRLSPLTRRCTALALLLLFLQVTVGQCLCAAVGPGAARATGHGQPAHPGCHGHGPAVPLAATAKPHHEPARQSHDCCKDKSAAILKALTTPPVAKSALHGPLLLGPPPGLNFTLPRSASWRREQAVALVSPQHLPPKIPDVRVFLRSLTV